MNTQVHHSLRGDRVVYGPDIDLIAVRPRPGHVSVVHQLVIGVDGFEREPVVGGAQPAGVMQQGDRRGAGECRRARRTQAGWKEEMRTRLSRW